MASIKQILLNHVELDSSIIDYLGDIIEQIQLECQCSPTDCPLFDSIQDQVTPFIEEISAEKANLFFKEILDYLKLSHQCQLPINPVNITEIPTPTQQNPTIQSISTPTTIETKATEKILSKKELRKQKRHTKTKKQVVAQQHNTIRALSQCSRFHEETLDTNSRTISLKQAYVSIGSKELLKDSDLVLIRGVRYGLIGRNGCGKSTLLRALGTGLFEGIPSHLRIMYVDQLETDDDLEALNVVDAVLKADTITVYLQQRLQQLHAAMKSNDTYEVGQTLYAIQLEELESKVAAMTKIADKRSGERGHQARYELVQLETQLAQKQQETLKQFMTQWTAVEMSTQLHHLIETTYEELRKRDVESAMVRAQETLSSMGFSKSQQTRRLKELSGGWRIRVALARALFLKPDVLLLDEPTNHLDLPCILWLENYLANELHAHDANTTLVVVSHDRSFLNKVCDRIIHFTAQGTLEYFMGNYESFEHVKMEKNLFNLRLEEKLEKKKKHLEDSIQKCKQGAKQKKGTDDKRLQVAATKKMKMNRLGNEKNDKGHRFKLNRDRAGYFFKDSVRAGAGEQYTEPPVHWKIPTPTSLGSGADNGALPLISLSNVFFKYETSTNWILQNIQFTARMKDRIAVLGENGSGKSTLLKILTKELTPSQGEVKYHTQHVRVDAFMQHSVETLMTEYAKDASLTPLTYLIHRASEKAEGEQLTEVLARQHLSRFGIRGDLATKQSLASLSGGQAVRVAFSVCTWPYSPHVLLLDEPTNHLDIQTIDAMIAALNGFEGAIILVSHDESFVSKLNCNAVYAFQQQRFSLLENGLEEYVLNFSK